jgi:hypothetical protein
LGRPTSKRADRDATDRRQLVAAVPGLQHRRLATRGEGAPHRRRQEETRLVQKYQVGLTPEGVADDPAVVIVQPPRHLLVVTLAGPLAGLLRGPAQAAAQDLANVLGVVAAAEVALNQAGDAGGGPQLVVPAVRLGTQQQQFFEVPQLAVGEAGLGTRLRFRIQAARLACQAEPAAQGLGVDAEDAGDVGPRLTLLNQEHGATPPAFQFVSSSNRSTHITLDAPTQPRVTFSGLDAVA